MIFCIIFSFFVSPVIFQTFPTKSYPHFFTPRFSPLFFPLTFPTNCTPYFLPSLFTPQFASNFPPKLLTSFCPQYILQTLPQIFPRKFSYPKAVTHPATNFLKPYLTSVIKSWKCKAHAMHTKDLNMW